MGVKNTNPAVHKVLRLAKDGSKVVLIRIQCFSLLKMLQVRERMKDFTKSMKQMHMFLLEYSNRAKILTKVNFVH